jgi:hypothetical protein
MKQEPPPGPLKQTCVLTVVEVIVVEWLADAVGEYEVMVLPEVSEA